MDKMDSSKVIRLQIVTVTKKASAEISTYHYTYKEKKEGEVREERESSRSDGAEWEEIGFAVESEEQPTVQIANIIGSTFLVGPCKLIINNPDLFGIYKVGDIIEFMPVQTVITN